MSGGCRIPLFAFSPSLRLERARIMGPSVGRLPPSKVRERGDRRGTGYDCCTASSSISPARRLGAHTRAPAAACPFAATPAEPGGKGVRSPGSSPLRAAHTRRGGGGCTDPRQRLCRALGAAGGGGEAGTLPARRLSCPAAGAPGEGPTGVPRSAAPGPPPPHPEPAPAAAAERGRRPPPHPPSPARAAASRGEAVPLSRSEEEDGGEEKGVPPWRASPFPGAALVERGIAEGAAGTGLRRAPAAVFRASRAHGGSPVCTVPPAPGSRRSPVQAPGGPAAGSARSLPAPGGRAPPRRLGGPGGAAAGVGARRRSFPRSPARSVIPGRVLGSPGRRGAAASGVPGQVRPVRGGRLALSPTLQGGRLCCKQEPARYINTIYPTVQKPSGCLPFPQRRLPAPFSLGPCRQLSRSPQRRYLQRAPANLNSPCPARPSGK